MNKEMKVGDILWYNTSTNYYSASFIQSSKIVRITPGGKMILENGRAFKNGREMKSKGNSYPRSSVISEQQAKEMMDRAKKDSEKSQIIHEFKDALSGKRCGNGTYNLNDEQLAKIKEVTELLRQR